MHATGTFQVDVTPQTPGDTDLPRFLLTKTWSGDLTGTSKGEMLTSTVQDTGLRTYVALERVDATIAGKQGSFLLRHFATMLANDGKSAFMEIAVVPDSGTGALAGVTGTLKIDASGGEHRYELAYTLPGQP